MLWPGDLITGVLDWPTALVAAAIALLAVAYARPMRAFVIWIAQYSAFLAVALLTAVGGRHGYATGLAIGQAQNINDMGQMYYAVGGAAVGGLLGLVGGALAASVFFVLLEIRQNTRE
jgi:hypothetical protein